MPTLWMDESSFFMFPNVHFVRSIDFWDLTVKRKTSTSFKIYLCKMMNECLHRVYILHWLTPTPSNAFVWQQRGGERGTHWRHFHCQQQCLRLAAAWWWMWHSLKAFSSPTPVPLFYGSMVALATLIKGIFIVKTNAFVWWQYDGECDTHWSHFQHNPFLLLQI